MKNYYNSEEQKLLLYRRVKIYRKLFQSTKKDISKVCRNYSKNGSMENKRFDNIYDSQF